MVLDGTTRSPRISEQTDPKIKRQSYLYTNLLSENQHKSIDNQLFQRGSTRHVTSRHDDVLDTESTIIVEVLPVGYQVTSLLRTLL
jgi:uncharacterized alpha/beta hydrolase family protein